MPRGVLFVLLGLASAQPVSAEEVSEAEPSGPPVSEQGEPATQSETDGVAKSEPPVDATDERSPPVDEASAPTERHDGADQGSGARPSSSHSSSETKASAAEAAKEANNPLSNLTSISLQDYKTLDWSQDTDQNRDQGISNVLYVRFAKSIGDRVIVRASLPVVSTHNEGTSGLGDMNIIVPVLLNKMDSPLKFGVGPLANLPTHTDNLGANALGLGISATAFYMKNPVFQPGALVTWSYNIAPGTPADEGNLLTAQPFLFFQLGHGSYLRSSAIATVDFENERYNIPVGLGVGQVLKQDRVVFNAYIEGQQTVWSYGALLPTSQLFFGLNVQILPK